MDCLVFIDLVQSLSLLDGYDYIIIRVLMIFIIFEQTCTLTIFSFIKSFYRRLMTYPDDILVLYAICNFLTRNNIAPAGMKRAKRSDR